MEKEHRKAHRVLHRCHNNRRCASADSQICERKTEEQREERIKKRKLFGLLDMVNGFSY